MKVDAIDTTKLAETVKILESRYQHRKAHPIEQSDEVWYELLAEYFRRIMTAKEEGKYIVGHTVLIPTEIFYAMDIVPMHLENTAAMISNVLNKFDDSFNAAKAFGLTPEVCSGHRLLAANIVQGWLPRPDAFVWSNQVCDNTAKSGDLLIEAYGTPGFFLDRPYSYSPRAVKYFAQALRDLIHFLEEHTKRKMDWDRLRETLEYSRQIRELYREMAKLRKAIPAPMRNRRFIHLLQIEWYWGGTPEAIRFFECVRDEIKRRVGEKKGFAPEERYRLLTLFLPPMSMWKLLDWMEKEQGAVSVMEPYCFHWGEIEIDPHKPLESLAQKNFQRVICRQMHGPADEGIVKDSVSDALEYQAEGAIYWAHIGCRQACACIRMVKDALAERAGIPTLVLDNDALDPTFTPEDELRDKLEGFFEILEGRK
jgi:benzoyl-CoA reductase/2-hydroxyglutaryl-CoA dehydratase subunit BcrC/BadD/HgdB